MKPALRHRPLWDDSNTSLTAPLRPYLLQTYVQFEIECPYHPASLKAVAGSKSRGLQIIGSDVRKVLIRNI